MGGAGFGGMVQRAEAGPRGLQSEVVPGEFELQRLSGQERVPGYWSKGDSSREWPQPSRGAVPVGAKRPEPPEVLQV